MHAVLPECRPNIDAFEVIIYGKCKAKRSAVGVIVTVAGACN